VLAADTTPLTRIPASTPASAFALLSVIKVIPSVTFNSSKIARTTSPDISNLWSASGL
jgi:hypothetical protein